MMTAAERAQRLLAAGQLTDAMKRRAVDLGLLTPAQVPEVTAALTNATTIRTQAQTALATNRAFIALGSPSNAQVVAQVKALTRQSNGVIRLLLDQLDDTD